MKWTIEHDPTDNFFRVNCYRQFSDHDCRKMLDALAFSEDWRRDADILIDYRETDFTGIRVDDLQIVLNYHKQLAPVLGDGKLALVMGSVRDLQLARQYEMLNEKIVHAKIMVFDDDEKAIAWFSTNRF
ncbi:MAG TPA: hypothetical protein VIL74_12750 [Pyrinomonadaceae bacterium]|jgi:hypothetical protein